MDLFSDGMRRNPYPAFDRMRSGSPVFHLAPFDLWIIFDFDGVKRALVDHDAFSSDLSHVPCQGNPGEWFIFFGEERGRRSFRSDNEKENGKQLRPLRPLSSRD